MQKDNEDCIIKIDIIVRIKLTDVKFTDKKRSKDFAYCKMQLKMKIISVNVFV